MSRTGLPPFFSPSSVSYAPNPYFSLPELGVRIQRADTTGSPQGPTHFGKDCSWQESLTSSTKAVPSRPHFSQSKRHRADLIQSSNSTTNLISIHTSHVRNPEIVPFSDPYFLPMFSEFGRSACELDTERGRPAYPIGGMLPLRGVAISRSLAFILPAEAFVGFQPYYDPPPGAPTAADRQSGLLPPPPPIPAARQQHRPHQGPAHAPAIPPRPIQRLAGAARHAASALRRDEPNPLGLADEDRALQHNNTSRTKRQKRQSRTHQTSKRHSSDELVSQLPFTKGENRLDETLPPKAQAFIDAIKEYKRAGFSASVEAINRDRFRPLHFPFSLVQKLLRGLYICPGKVLHPDDYDAKKIPKPTDSFKSVRHLFSQEREWRRIVEIIRSAVIFAFPCAKNDVSAYFNHVFDMANLFAAQGDWSSVVDYDAQLRLAFATRPTLTYSDFDAPELLAVRTLVTTANFSCSRHQAFPHAPSTYPNPYAPSASTHTNNYAPSAYANKAPNHATKRKTTDASAPRAIWAGSIKRTAAQTRADTEESTVSATWSTAMHHTHAVSTTTNRSDPGDTLCPSVLCEANSNLTK
ncbi:hypothetical protein DFH28DRAFT_933752 [Melampsora americana]|nr:hypothetical protein DFH28DRAFT_933752 [Melampsora americana]